MFQELKKQGTLKRYVCRLRQVGSSPVRDSPCHTCGRPVEVSSNPPLRAAGGVARSMEARSVTGLVTASCGVDVWWPAQAEAECRE